MTYQSSLISTVYSSMQKTLVLFKKWGNEYIQTLLTIFILPGINSKFSMTFCNVFLWNKLHLEYEMLLAEDCLLTCLHAFGISNTIVTFQSDDFYHYFENNTWNIENLLCDYYAYSKCIPTEMVFCLLWTDISFVSCTGSSGKKFWILETSHNKGNIKSDYLNICI